MRVISGVSYDDFVNKIKTDNLQIIGYGAGLAAMSIEDMFIESGIGSNVCCYIDGNPDKRGTAITLFGKAFTIQGISDLIKIDLSGKVILLTLEVFGAVIDDLSKYKELDGLPCYIFPELNRSYLQGVITGDNFCTSGYKNDFGSERIPRVIHYCWFGGGKMTDLMKDCISSWHEHNPSYEIIEWNESNYNINTNNYTKQVYETGQFAILSDYARLDILYKHGGIYLDVDIKAYKSFDGLLHNHAFIGYNEWPIVASAVCGSTPKSEIIRLMRDDPRSNMNFINEDGSYNLAYNCFYETNCLARFGFKKDFSYQKVMGMAVYPPCFFNHLGKLGLLAEIDERTYTVHMGARSWADEKLADDLYQTNKFVGKMGVAHDNRL